MAAQGEIDYGKPVAVLRPPIIFDPGTPTARMSLTSNDFSSPPFGVRYDPPSKSAAEHPFAVFG